MAAQPGQARTPGFLPTEPPPPPVDRLQLSLDIVEPAWLRVTVDGQKVFEGLAEGGTARTYEARQSIHVRTSNAGAIQMSLNGEPFERLGRFGKTVETEWVLKDGRVRIITNDK